MRPEGDHVLRTVGANMLSKYLPGYETDPQKADFGLMALMVLVVSEEFERSAHRRIEENKAFRKLFENALPVVKDKDLKGRLKKAMKKPEDDYHISALDQLNCELQEVLIDLHAHVETLEGADARRIEETIWQELENWTKRREFMIWQLVAAMMNAGE
jgi:hypothetical protein